MRAERETHPETGRKRQVKNQGESKGQVSVDPALAHPQASVVEVGLGITQATVSEAQSPSWSLSTSSRGCV